MKVWNPALSTAANVYTEYADPRRDEMGNDDVTLRKLELI